MTHPRTSVIVVSRGRPAMLRRCLRSLAQLDHPDFEIVVVADTEGRAAVAAEGLTDAVKCIPCEEPNVSAARNLGLSAAAGEIAAFLDDDAVAEPTWLSALTAPFADPDVTAAAGYVRGRNGISFQARAAWLDRLGRETPMEVQGGDAVVARVSRERAVKTEGTNCAFRLSVICAMGGFDPALRFFHDETDLDLRLGTAGAAVAVVPGAQVHHGVAPSGRRLASRMPLSLHDVGASSAVLLRKHAPEADRDAFYVGLRAEQRTRLLRHMVAGTCMPRDVPRVMATLDAGIAEGEVRAFGDTPPLSADPPPFLPFPDDLRFHGMAVLSGWTPSAARLRQEAAARVAAGERVSLFLFGPSSFYHRVRFTEDGVWEQRGGLFGRSERNQPLMRAVRFRTRLQEEVRRVAKLRGFAWNSEQ
jgi:GT2 family glycosyltransferase